MGRRLGALLLLAGQALALALAPRGASARWGLRRLQLACDDVRNSSPEQIGDGHCDSGRGGAANNNEACGWDGGDCCEVTCVSTEANACGGGQGYDCREPGITPSGRRLLDDDEDASPDLSGTGTGNFCEALDNAIILLNTDTESTSPTQSSVEASISRARWTFVAAADTSLTSDLVGAPVLSPSNSALYVGSMNQLVYSISTAGGGPIFVFNVGGAVQADMALSATGSTLFAGTQEGVVWAIATAGGGDATWNSTLVNATEAASNVVASVDERVALSPDGAVVYSDAVMYRDGLQTGVRMYALNAVDGSQRWQRGVGFALSGFTLSAAGDRLFVIADGCDGKGGGEHYSVFALDAADGSELWRYPGGEACGRDDGLLAEAEVSPDGSIVYVVGYTGDEDAVLHAIDSASGQPLWNVTRVGERFGPAPAVSGDGTTLYIGASEMGLYAYSVSASGAVLLWQGQEKIGTTDFTQPVLSPDERFVYLNTGTRGDARCYDANTGALLWDYDLISNLQIYKPIVDTRGETLYFGSGGRTGSGALYALNTGLDKFIWEYSVRQPHKQPGQPVLSASNSDVYFAEIDQDNVRDTEKTTSFLMYRVGTARGVTKWAYDFGGTFAELSGAPVLSSAEDVLYLCVNDGTCFALETAIDAGSRLAWTFNATAQNVTELASAVDPAEKRTMSTPAVTEAQGVFFSTYWNTVYALDLGGGASPQVLWTFHAYGDATTMKNGTTTDAEGAIWGGPLLSPDEQTLYFVTKDGHLYAVDAATGVEQNRRRTGRLDGGQEQLDEGGMEMAISADGGVLYLWGGLPFQQFIALNTSSFAVAWAYPSAPQVQDVLGYRPELSVDGSVLYVGSVDDNLYALNATTGERMWTFVTAGTITAKPSLNAEGTVVFAASGDGSVYAVEGDTGSLLFSYATGGGTERLGLKPQSPVVRNDGTAVYAASEEGTLFALRTSGPPVAPTFNGITATSIDGGVELCNINPVNPAYSEDIESFDFQVYRPQAGEWRWAARDVTVSPDTACATVMFPDALDLGVEYEWRGLARTVGGLSPPSDSHIDVKICSTPAALTEVVATPLETGNVGLTWAQITDLGVGDSGDSEEFDDTYYDVYASDNGTWHLQQTFAGTQTLTSVTVENLEARARVAFRVVVRNACGLESAQSNASNSTLVLGRPSAPYDVNATYNAMSGVVDLEWRTAAEEDLIQARVDYSLLSNGVDVTIGSEIVEGGEARRTSISTTRGISYAFSVVVYNENFESLAGSAAGRVTADCEAGRVLDTETEGCVPCEPGYYRNSSQSQLACVPCDPGFFQSNTTSTSCAVCAAGFVSDAAASSCSICEPGRYASADNTMCLDCEAGSSSLGGTDSCSGCESGVTYQPDEGASSCLPCASCPAGTKVAAPCEPGGPDTACTQCTAGTYQNQTNQLECATAPPGTFTGDGAVTPTACARGTFQEGIGAESCDSCPGGRFQNQTGQAFCYECGEGYFCAEGSFKETECQDSVLVLCPAGSAEPFILDLGSVGVETTRVNGTMVVEGFDEASFDENVEALYIQALAEELGVDADYITVELVAEAAVDEQDRRLQTPAPTVEVLYTIEGPAEEIPADTEAALTTGAAAQAADITTTFNAKLADAGDATVSSVSIEDDAAVASGVVVVTAGPGEYIYDTGLTQSVETCVAGSFCTGGELPMQPCPAGTFSAARGAQNCTSCPLHTYQASRNTTSCSACPNYSVTASNGSFTVDSCKCLFGTEIPRSDDAGGFTCGCLSGEYLDENELERVAGSTDRDDFSQVCVACPEGADCSSDGQRLRTLTLKRGYYRTRPNSADILECFDADACPASNATGDAQCRPGHEGPYCAVCEPNHFLDAQNQLCSECSTANSRDAIITTIILVSVVLLCLVYCFCCAGDEHDEEKEEANDVLRLPTGRFGPGHSPRPPRLLLPVDEESESKEAPSAEDIEHVISPRSSVLSPRSSVLSPKSSVLSLKSMVLSESVLSERDSGFGDEGDVEGDVEFKDGQSFERVERYVAARRAFDLVAETKEAQEDMELATGAAAAFSTEDQTVEAGEDAVNDHMDSFDIFRSLKTRLKIVFSFLQIEQLAILAFDLPAPPDFSSFLNAFSFVSFNLFTGIIGDCIVDADYFHGLVVTTLAPLVVILFALLLRALARSKKTREGLTYLAFATSFVALPVATTMSCNTFLCDTLDTADGTVSDKSYLVADYSIECDTPRHDIFKVYAACMILVHPIGIPLFYCYLLLKKDAASGLSIPQALYRLAEVKQVLRELAKQVDPLGFKHERTEDSVDELLTYCNFPDFQRTFTFLKRRDLRPIAGSIVEARFYGAQLRNSAWRVLTCGGGMEDDRSFWEAARGSDDATLYLREKTEVIVEQLRHARFLLEAYEPRFWFFEICECVRRLSFTILPVFFERGSVSQLLTGCLATNAYAIVYFVAQPFVNDSDDVLAAGAQTAVFLLFLYGLAEAARDDPFRGQDDDNIGSVLIAINVIVIAAVVWVALLTMYQLMRHGKEVARHVGAHVRRRRRSTLANSRWPSVYSLYLPSRGRRPAEETATAEETNPLTPRGDDASTGGEAERLSREDAPPDAAVLGPTPDPQPKPEPSRRLRRPTWFAPPPPPPQPSSAPPGGGPENFGPHVEHVDL
uniref:Fibronectin type-III domain-containing protein n=1 Tax=Phaeomonas parva TaxID=124430 RepID=A0A7S1U7E3_9STRA